jgi:hypothetical protein
VAPPVPVFDVPLEPPAPVPSSVVTVHATQMIAMTAEAAKPLTMFFMISLSQAFAAPMIRRAASRTKRPERDDDIGAIAAASVQAGRSTHRPPPPPIYFATDTRSRVVTPDFNA